jgi:hypothetical protein
MKLIDLKYDSDLRKQISNPIGKTVSKKVRDYFLHRSVVIENVLKTLVPAIKGAINFFFLTTHLWSRDHQVLYEYTPSDDEQHRISAIFECLLEGVSLGGGANE